MLIQIYITTINWKFSDKNSDIFRISVQNIGGGYLLEPPRRGGSNKYQQSIFRTEIWKNNVYPSKPHFYYIKVRFKGFKITGMFSWRSSWGTHKNKYKEQTMTGYSEIVAIIDRPIKQCTDDSTRSSRDCLRYFVIFIPRHMTCRIEEK